MRKASCPWFVVPVRFWRAVAILGRSVPPKGDSRRSLLTGRAVVASLASVERAGLGDLPASPSRFLGHPPRETAQPSCAGRPPNAAALSPRRSRGDRRGA